MRRNRSFLAFLTAVLLLSLPACDFVGEEETLQLRKTVEFRFEFSTNGQVGEPVTVQSEGGVDIEDELFAEGYTREDIGAANIRSVEIERIQPVGTDLDVFDQMNLSLTAPGVTVPTNASSDNLPASSSASLDVQAAGVSEVVREPEFGARITVVPTVADDFILRATVDLRIDIQEN